MSRHGDVVLEWADGEHTFRLDIGALRKLQERCDAGPYELLRRLTTGSWRLDDIRETIRLGLIAGGAVKTDAGALDDRRINRLITEYVDERPLLQSVMVAARILEAALSGAPDEEIPKSAAVEDSPRSLNEESSPSPPSLAGDQSSDTRRKKSTRSLSGNSARARPATSSPTA